MSPFRHSLLAALALALPLADDPQFVDFATLSDFDYVEGMELPAHVRAFDGKKVKIAGFMQREDGSQGDTAEFMLINEACGCNGTPFLNEIVFCTMPAGQTTPMRPGIVTVTGTLWIGEIEEGGIVVSLYTMDVESVSD